MPYDFLKKQPYHFCYDDLYDTLANSILHDQISYINAWKLIFERLELNVLSSTLYLPIGTCFFQYEFTTAQSSFLIHFNIDNISNNINQKCVQASSISLSNFGTEDAPIIYNKEIYNNNHLISKKPIIIVPFPLDKATSGIVIDGNHRVSAKITNNHNKIYYYLYTPSQKSDFCSELDWVMYLFYMEVFQISSMIINGADIDNLISRSYVYKNFSHLIK